MYNYIVGCDNMKFIKKHKSLIVALIVFVLVLVLFLLVYRSFFPDEETAIYGSRLEGIEKVELKKTDITKIEDALKGISKKTTVRTQGRIIEVMVSLNDEVNRDTAKAESNKIITSLSKGQREYYDIQVFISKEGQTEDAAQFPIIGYKHHISEGFTWTKDR